MTTLVVLRKCNDQFLVERLDGPDVIGITISGSYARGEANTYSDVDLQRYVRTRPEKASERYYLRRWDGRLVSIHTGTVEAEYARLRAPQRAIWAVPGLRQARILLDKDGSLADLKRAAETLSWDSLQPAADEYAADTLTGCAEEVHKVLGGLARCSESATLYATWGLVKELPLALLVQRGVLIPSENAYIDLVQDAAGRDSAWTRTFRLAAGFDPAPPDHSLAEERGGAALGLYRETASLFRPILRPEHLEVIEPTLATIQKAGY